MGVLDGWDQQSMVGGVALVQQRRAAEGLRDGWSIAELRLDDADRQALWAWYQGLSRDTLLRHLELSYSPQGASEHPDPPEVARERFCYREEAIGLLLLAAMAEQLRFHGKLGQVWSTIRLLRLNPRAEELLFHGNGQPTPALRAALEAAARFFRLRHVFDDEEPRHAWATTLSLQFVFPIPDTPGHLAEWLVGHPPPIALQKILAEQGSSLGKVWATLRKARTRDDSSAARIALSSSPWFDGHDHIALVADAFRRVSLPPSTQALAIATEDEDEPMLLGVPRLLWSEDGAPPRLVASVLEQPVGAEGCKKVVLLVDGEPRCKLLRQGDSMKTLQPTEIDLPWREEIVVALVDAQAPQEPLTTQTVRLKRSSVEVFARSSGERLEHVSDHEVSLVLWVPEGARSVPELPSLSVEGGVLLEMTPPWPPRIDVHLGEEPLLCWSRRTPRAAPVVQPRERRAVGLYVCEPRGERRVEPQDELEVRAVRLAPTRVVLPEGWQQPRLMAGSKDTGRVRLRAAPLRGLLGLGEPLVALDGPLVGVSEDAPELTLAGAVVDHGLVLNFEEGTHHSRLRLALPLELESTSSLLIAWPRSGQPFTLPCRLSSAEDGQHAVEFELPSGIRALGLNYRGTCLGSWWFDGWHHELERCGLESAQVLLLLRWLRLPLLQETGEDPVNSPRFQVAMFARKHLADALFQWGVVPGYPPPALRLTSGDQALVLPLEERWSDARKELGLGCAGPLERQTARELRERVYFNHLHQPQAQALAPFFEALLRLGATLPRLLNDALESGWANAFRMIALRVPPNTGFSGQKAKSYRSERIRELSGGLAASSTLLEQEFRGAMRNPSRRQRALLHRDDFARLVAYESLTLAGEK
jgi:hypothetical protein